MISVVMSVYREPVQIVQEALDSIICQTYQDYELIVVLDDPKNETMYMFLTDYAQRNPQVTILKNLENMGLARSLNRGIHQAKGEYIARMDADDRSLPNRLEKELMFLEHGGYEMVSSLAEFIDEDGLVWGSTPLFPDDERSVVDMLLIKNVIIHPTVLMRKSMVERLGGYRNFASAQDYDFWLRMITDSVRFGVINEKLLQFRIRAGSVTGTKRLNQYLNEQYSRILYRQRLERGEDDFSEEALEQFLIKHRYYDKPYVAKENKLMQRYREGVQDIKSHRIVRGALIVFRSLAGSACVRDNLRSTVKTWIIRLKYR